MRPVILFYLFFLFSMKVSAQEVASKPKATSKSIDQRISTPLNERDFAMSPDGKEIYFTRSSFDNRTRFIAYIQLKDGEWTEAKVAPFSGNANDLEPFISPDGKRLFFASNRSVDGGVKRDFDIWYVEKLDLGWGEAIRLDTLINTPKNEFYPAVSSNGNLYFTATRSDSKGTEDIYLSRYENGKYATPISLDSTINTETYEYNAYISPDEQTLIFGSYGRPDDLGGGDLYISRKNEAGLWQSAKHMGPEINTDVLDYCPFLDSENELLYFTSNKGQSLNTEDLKKFEEVSLSVKNGFGNIYSIPFKTPAQK